MSDISNVETVVELFATTVKLMPNNLAIEHNGNAVSYIQLDEMSNQIADLLRRCGVRRGDFVMLASNRSPNIIIGMLAIFKIGAVYAPIDTNSPLARINYIVSDIKPSMIIVDNDNYSFGKDIISNRILIDYLAINAEVKSSNSYDRQHLSAEDPAYIMYTSGTTGNPKGVLIKHSSLINHNKSCIKRFNLSSSDIVLQLASVAFDHALEQIWPTLLAGGVVSMYDDARGVLPAEIYAFIQEKNITAVNVPYSVWSVLVDWLRCEGIKLALPSARFFAVGGEECCIQKLDEWDNLGGDQFDFYNGYGPTETTIMSCMWKKEKGNKIRDSHLKKVPIGMPLDNVKHVVLDENDEICKPGEIGELYIGGLCLGLGYHNKQDLTKEKFVSLTINDTANFFYRTGDLVSYDKDSIYVFHGRKDDQVKIAGYRVELGEVEYAIKNSGLVYDAVCAKKTDNGISSIVAFIKPIESKFAASELMERMKQNLPAYAVPSEISTVKDFPLNANGKVDRNQMLAVLESSGSKNSAMNRNIDEIISDIWKRKTGSNEIDSESSFFEAGGNSLAIISFVNELNKLLGIKIKPSVVFRYPKYNEILNIVKAEIEV